MIEQMTAAGAFTQDGQDFDAENNILIGDRTTVAIDATHGHAWRPRMGGHRRPSIDGSRATSSPGEERAGRTPPRALRDFDRPSSNRRRRSITPAEPVD